MFDDARWGDDPRDRHDEQHVRDRDDDACHEPGRGPGSSGRDDQYADDARTRDRDDVRDPFERDRDSRDREDRERDEARDVFVRHVDLPRGIDREIVRDRGREYTLRGSETRTLSTVSAFRVVPARDLRDHDGRAADPRSGDLRHLREQGLVETLRLPDQRDHAVVFTKHGPSFPHAPGVVEAVEAQIRLILPRLEVVHAQRLACGRQLEQLLQQLRDRPRDAVERGEDRDIAILESLPGVGRKVAVTMLAEAAEPLAHRDYARLRAHMGTAPVTTASGKRRLVSMRRA